ncbi:hypothetical protein EDD85DRAFT_615933 [Armillaria nabsnona]|nr:hypothetical protein EDD85DRAFT_615933 [Armillaria nabsnona]
MRLRSFPFLIPLWTRVLHSCLVFRFDPGRFLIKCGSFRSSNVHNNWQRCCVSCIHHSDTMDGTKITPQHTAALDVMWHYGRELWAEYRVPTWSCCLGPPSRRRGELLICDTPNQ